MKSFHHLGAVPELVVDGEILLDFALSETVTLNLVLAPNHSVALTDDSLVSQLSILARARNRRQQSFLGRSFVFSQGTMLQGQSAALQ
jgi:hypothetical protein